MTEDIGRLINEHLMQMAEHLPLFERINLNDGVFKNLTLQEIHTIALIGKLDSPRMSELAKRGHVTTGTMTVMVNKLVKKGLVERSRDPGDRRVVHAHLTPRGRRVEKMHEVHHKDVMDMVLGVLTEAEQKQALRIIRKITSIIP